MGKNSFSVSRPANRIHMTMPVWYGLIILLIFSDFDRPHLPAAKNTDSVGKNNLIKIYTI